MVSERLASGAATGGTAFDATHSMWRSGPGAMNRGVHQSIYNPKDGDPSDQKNQRWLLGLSFVVFRVEALRFRSSLRLRMVENLGVPCSPSFK